jgi:multiple sugar transport system ATP-binding protein
MNFIPCEADVAQRCLRGENLTIPISERSLERLSGHKGSRLTLGIRPASLKIEKTPSEGQPRGEVFAVEPRGDSAVVSVLLGKLRLLSESAENLKLKEDDVVGLTFPEDQIHLFDSETGINLFERSANS